MRIREAKDRAHPRTIDLPTSSLSMLERTVARARSQAGAAARDPLLLPDAEHEIARRLGRWQKLIGEPRLSARNLRHTFGTLLLQSAGASPTEAMAALGHRRIGTTGRYVAAVGARARVLAEQLGQALMPPHPTPTQVAPVAPSRERASDLVAGPSEATPA